MPMKIFIKQKIMEETKCMCDVFLGITKKMLYNTKVYNTYYRKRRDFYEKDYFIYYYGYSLIELDRVPGCL